MQGTSRHPFVQPIGILLVCSNTSGRAVPFRWPPYPIRYTRTRKRRTEDPTCVEMMSKRDRGLIDNDDDDESSSSENESESYFDVPNIHALSSNHRDDDAASQAPSTSSSRRTVGGIRSSLTTTLLRAPSDPSSPAAGNIPLPPPPPDRNPSSGTPFSPAEYKYFLGLDLVELAKVLTPQEDLCQQQFELVIDDLCFLGHPLRPVGQGLTWKFVDEDTEKSAPEVTRGRTNAPRVALSTGSTLGVQGITSATNAASEQAIEEPATPTPSRPRLSLSTSSSDPTPINFFHLVIVIDQPDTTVKDKALRPTRKLDALYRQLIFKVTAALLKAQVEENWVAIQNHELVGMRETFLKKQIPWEDFLRHAVETNPLANALHTIYESLFKPPFSTTIKIASLPLYLQLPVLPAQTDLDWSWFDEIAFPDDEGDDSPLLAAGEIQMVPWKALLLLKDPAQMEWEYKSRTTSGTWTASQRSRQPSGAWFGSGLGGTFTDIEPERRGTSTGSPIGGNGEVEEVREEDEESSIASKLFMRALEPGMNLADVATALNLDLKKDVFPMARLLVSRRKAKLIDPIKSATRNYYLPSTSDGKDMARLQVDFQRHFPQLPHLLTFFSRITLAGPVPYATLIPDVMDPDQRRLYFDALIWLLREDLLIEAPLRVRVFARREIKLEAKRIEVASMQVRALEKKMQREATVSVVERSGSVVGGGSKTATFEDVFAQDYSEDEEAIEDEDEEDEGIEDVDWMGEESLINNPAQCKGIELAWINAMCLDKSEEDKALFMRLFKYFDGKTTIHEMQYREQRSRKEITRVLKKFEQDLIVTIHP